MSPILEAAPGSSGYGVTDPTRVDRELGGEPGRELLLAELRRHGLGLVVDIVPNHMAADPRNPWWADVLAHGRLSRWANHFDIWWGEDASAPGEPAHRRFFDITGLVGVRQEEPEVFLDTHRLVLDWVAAGEVDGLRVDHPDGLREPGAYFRRLRESAPGAWILAEKILGAGERLAADWPVAGTTGYDFMNIALRLFVNPGGEAPLTDLYREFTGEGEDFPEVAHSARLEVLNSSLTPEVEHLVRVAGRQGQAAFREALVEYLACVGVYRTYLCPGQPPGEADSSAIAGAVAAARRRRPDLDPALFEVASSAELAPDLQQLSGAAVAKGVEDTAFYRYNRLVALNEVGGDPGRMAASPEEFHGWCAGMAEDWPARMNGTATHDTKRGEDVRARLAYLSEVPEDWAASVRAWRRACPDFADPSLQYLLFQVAVGAHPLPEERAQAYMVKAAREAKRATSWTRPDERFEAELAGLVRSSLPLVAELAGKLEEPGWRNSLALKLLCLTAPGVPDVYQGGELWDLSLVDPDNRRPVDFALRAGLLARLDFVDAAAAWAGRAQGLPKLLLVQRVLGLRRRRPDLYGPSAGYEPLPVTGDRAGHAVAFIRGGGAVTVIPRLQAGLSHGWSGTRLTLPGGGWRDELTGADHDGGPQDLGRLLARFPVALLVRRD